MPKGDKLQYLVTSTFTDKETGDVVLPGSYFAATEQRARRLQAAGVIADDDTGTPLGTDPTNPAPDADKKPSKPKTTKTDTPDVPDTSDAPNVPDVPDAGGDTNADNPTEG
ncbi:hypothetical protein [Paenibacillus sp. EKM211P]|uniref:hypothetical protein n=1 Tax=Paenibacillus sp. EKM211P TaxID=1683679 RepID=UPI0013E9876A|nr:hypothetical protein [Paenibacillus sp. EKM211P]KAF6584993.1 hypothetical protein G9G57_07480 [Paenibacillus sp. EKM211P]